MYELDKLKFGAFVSTLRKAKGLTQKKLAALLQISDKAVSKWETGVSIPDTALLIPLSEVLGVSVTELLKGERLAEPMAPEEVEGIVKAVLTCGKEQRAWQEKTRWGPAWFAAALAGALGLWLNYRLVGALTESLATCTVLAALFGVYFCFLARLRLPGYYDQNAIDLFSDGPFRMNVPGVRFNNRSWPHILKACRIWAVTALAGMPWLAVVLGRVPFWGLYQEKILVVLTVGGLFLPVWVVGRKYR